MLKTDDTESLSGPGACGQAAGGRSEPPPHRWAVREGLRPTGRSRRDADGDPPIFVHAHVAAALEDEPENTEWPRGPPTAVARGRADARWATAGRHGATSASARVVSESSTGSIQWAAIVLAEGTQAVELHPPGSGASVGRPPAPRYASRRSRQPPGARWLRLRDGSEHLRRRRRQTSALASSP